MAEAPSSAEQPPALLENEDEFEEFEEDDWEQKEEGPADADLWERDWDDDDEDDDFTKRLKEELAKQGK